MQVQTIKRTFDTSIVKLALLGGVAAAAVGLGAAGVTGDLPTAPWQDAANAPVVSVGSAHTTTAAQYQFLEVNTELPTGTAAIVAGTSGETLETMRFLEANLLPDAAPARDISTLQMHRFYEANGVALPDAGSVAGSTSTWSSIQFIEQNQLPESGTSLSQQLPNTPHFTP